MKYILVPVKTNHKKKNNRLSPSNEEFGRACRNSQLIQAAFNLLTCESKDCRKRGQLTRLISKAMKTDEVNGWGERKLQDGDITLLQGYDFNARKKLSTVLRKAVAARINGATGICSVAIHSFIPSKHLSYDNEPTHVRFSIGAASFDFRACSFNHKIVRSDFLPMQKETDVILLSVLDVADDQPILMVMGIEFFKKINGRYELLRTGGSTCLNIVQTGRGIVNP